MKIYCIVINKVRLNWCGITHFNNLLTFLLTQTKCNLGYLYLFLFNFDFYFLIFKFKGSIQIFNPFTAVLILKKSYQVFKV